MLLPQALRSKAKQPKRLLQNAVASAAADTILQAMFHSVQKLQLHTYLGHAVASGIGI